MKMIETDSVAVRAVSAAEPVVAVDVTSTEGSANAESGAYGINDATRAILTSPESA